MTLETGEKIGLKEQISGVLSSGKEKIGAGVDTVKLKATLLGSKMVDLSKISNRNIEKAIEVIPSWVPVIPDYLKFQKRNSDVLTMLITGYDASRENKIKGSIGDRFKRALELQGEALVSGGKAVVDIFSTMTSFGESSVVGKSVEEVVEKVAKGEGPGMLVGSMSKLFVTTAEKVDNKQAKGVLIRIGKFWDYVNESKIAKGAIEGALKQSEHWKKVEDMSQDPNKKVGLIREVKQGVDTIRENMKKEI